jgi:hypothetical protein
MHYNVQLKVGEQSCYLVANPDRLTATVKSRNATAFETYKEATEALNRVMGLEAKDLRLLVRRESTFDQPVQVNVKSWRNGITAPLTVRSKLYVFKLQD